MDSVVDVTGVVADTIPVVPELMKQQHFHYVVTGLAAFAVIVACCWLFITLVVPRLPTKKGSAMHSAGQSIRANDMAALTGAFAAIGTLTLALASDLPRKWTLILAVMSGALAVTSAAFWIKANRHDSTSMKRTIEELQEVAVG